MARLPKWANTGLQRELFDRADLPALIPTLDHFKEKDWRRQARRSPAAFVWQGAGAWCRHVGRLAALDRPCGGPMGDRFKATARELTVERIRESRQLEDLERIAGWLDAARPSCSGSYLAGVWSRRELGELIVEIRNRITLLRLGRDRPREKGDRFELERIPDDRLEWLIQRHPNLDLVDRLRAERARRRG